MEQYYYNHMDKQKQAAYHAMLQGIRNLTDEFQIPALDADSLYNVFFQLRLDHPEIFWATGYKYRYYKDSPNIIFIPEYLFEKNKQIIVTSDRKASELNIMDRLKSRFTWGMQVDIKKPNQDLRKAILKSKLSTLIANVDDVSNDALDYIATNFEENVRELEGALRRFVNYCVAFNIDYTLENAKLSLESIISSNKSSSNEVSSSQAENVKTIVASYFNIPVKELSGSSRKQEIVYARSIAIYLLRTKYNIGLKKIGEYLGNRDHATVAHAIDKIEDGIKSDECISQDVTNLVDKLNK